MDIFAFLHIFVGLILLLLGGNVLVQGSSKLALLLRIPPLIVGLTVVGFCTSAPEIAVSVAAALGGQGDLAVGNVIGSNTSNICLILGIAAILAPISVSADLIRKEIPIMVGVLCVFYALAYWCGLQPSEEISSQITGKISSSVGWLLILGLVLYVLWTVIEALRNPVNNAEYNKDLSTSTEATTASNPMWQFISNTFLGSLIFSIFCIAAGLLMLIFGSNFLVQGAVSIAKAFGVSELMIGLTILAIGTSLPELVFCVIAAFSGKSDLAIGNVVGSNIFNVLGVLGPAAIFAKGGYLQVPHNAMIFDIPLCIGVSCLCFYICFTGMKVSRKEGMFLLTLYCGYIVYLAIRG
ncbi:MAG: calcium/sodium antiporter [Thermoguttaceae bacterium]